MIGTAIKLKKKYLVICVAIFTLCGLLLVQHQQFAKRNINFHSSRKLSEDSNSYVKIFKVVPEISEDVTIPKLKLSEDGNSYVKFSKDVPEINKDMAIPTLKEHAKEVPICIVDEHNEVIPYWYKAVDEGIIRKSGNTLIHIDGHSDMASPEEFNKLHKFKHHKKALQNSFLPLMQSNDVFIISAIMKGLISHVVWVQPSWNTDSKHTEHAKSFVGVTINNKTNEKMVCECHRYLEKGSNESEMECTYMDPESDDDVDVEIPQSECKMLKKFTFITVSEDKFIKSVILKKVKNLFVDIDEDYFGVASGVQNLIDEGINLKTVEEINGILGSLYCPDSVRSEQLLNRELKELFAFISQIENPSQLDSSVEIGMKLNSATRMYFCQVNKEHRNDIIIAATVKKFISMSKVDMIALSKAKYCLTNSPRLHSAESKFQLCHGTIYPEDTLNQIHVGKEEEITKRGKQITNMINFIYNYTEPRFFTIARSLRDGYTPRHQQRLIETVLLKSLDEAISKQGKQKKVIYDKELVFGKLGWT